MSVPAPPASYPSYAHGVRAMCPINVPDGLDRITQVIAAVDDAVFILNPDGTVYQCPTTGNFPGKTVQIACARGFAYFVDGTSVIRKMNVLDGGSADLVNLVATAGGVPVSGDTGQYGPTIIAFYRDRMVLSGLPGDEQNFFMSRSGTHTDFDYGQTDEAAAVAGNLSLGALVGSPIRALIAQREDVLVFGCDHSIWRMVGDIAAGGSVQLLTDSLGMLGPNSWTASPDGMIYFLGESDFYRLDPMGGLRNLSASRIHEFLVTSIDRNADSVSVQWDTLRQGCWIFISRPFPSGIETTPLSTHLWYDARNDSFWKIQLPRGYDPACAIGYDGYSNSYRRVLTGTRTGYVQQFDDTVASDNGNAIRSCVYLGPLNPAGDIREARCNGIDAILGDIPDGFTDAANWNMDWSMQAGKDAAKAIGGIGELRTGTFTASGEQRPIGIRAAGSHFALKLSNGAVDKLWSMDRIVGRFLIAGRRR